ncbi:MAG: lipoprotein [Lautropia sp.]|nr:lipoprotein [Lautropia sp.]
MRTSILITQLLSLVASVFLLTACGQKGPLYIPSRPDASLPTALASAPASTRAAADKPLSTPSSSGTHP